MTPLFSQLTSNSLPAMLTSFEVHQSRHPAWNLVWTLTPTQIKWNNLFIIVLNKSKTSHNLRTLVMQLSFQKQASKVETLVSVETCNSVFDYLFLLTFSNKIQFKPRYSFFKHYLFLLTFSNKIWFIPVIIFLNIASFSYCFLIKSDLNPVTVFISSNLASFS